MGNMTRPALVAEPEAKPGWWQSLLDQISEVFHTQDELDRDTIERPSVAAETTPSTGGAHRDLRPEPELTAEAPGLIKPESSSPLDPDTQGSLEPESSRDNTAPSELAADPEPAVKVPAKVDLDGPGAEVVPERALDEPEITKSGAELDNPDMVIEPHPEAGDTEPATVELNHDDTLTPASPLDESEHVIPEPEPSIAEPERALDEPVTVESDPRLICWQDDQWPDGGIIVPGYVAGHDEPTATDEPQPETPGNDAAELVPTGSAELENIDPSGSPEQDLSIDDTATTSVTSWFDSVFVNPIHEKDALTEKWVRALDTKDESEHAFGVWEESKPRVFGPDRRCVCFWQLAMDISGKDMQDMRHLYGDRFVDKGLDLNDRQHRSFKDLSAFVKKEQLSSGHRELELDR